MILAQRADPFHSTVFPMDSIAKLPSRLPCGLTLKNQLLKSAISERTAVNEMPTAAHCRVYARWAEGGWGMLVTSSYSEFEYSYLRHLIMHRGTSW